MVESRTLSELTFPCAMDNHQVIWNKKKATILDQLSSDELNQLLGHSIRIKKKRQEQVSLDETSKPHVYIIDKGYVRSCRVTDEGKRIITGFMGPADVFGSIFPAAPDTANDTVDYIEVVREARLIGIETDVFKQILEKHPKFLLRFIEILENRKRQLEKRILSLMSKDVYAQTAEILLELADKFAERCESDTGLYRDIVLTHQEIADLVGIARPTVSKIISDFLKADLLHKHQNQLCLYDKTGMQRMADYGQKAFAAALP